MRRFVILAVVVITTSLTGEIPHAPTVAQCQLDRRLFISQLEADAKTTLTFATLTDMSGEMEACYKQVDPPNARKYEDMESDVIVVQATRLSRFIRRHQMWGEFIAEDAAGKR